MASSVVFFLLLSAGLFTVTVGDGDDCKGYYTSSNVYKSPINCGSLKHCCGTCEYRYCCSSDSSKLTEDDQELCNITNNNGVTGIVSGIVGIVVICIVFTICCCCPCCCIYKMCQRPSPGGTHVTTVVNTQCIQQPPVMQPVQYPAYQPVPTQPGYGGQPMQTGPYQGQPYAPGPAPPPPYHMAASPGYPSGQAAYGASQAPYPMMPPAQPGITHLPQETMQPAYNPAYMQPPNTGY
ncbi:protein shisa-5-like isoform X2 [Pseudorasbora parva]|uniref:protein shisa-5-like isoform X2 n=1 Tax=Pseudorasbora parva TaxID=51549 RepID=UPI00351EB15C